MAGPDYSGITKGISGQFDYARQRAQQQESATLQGQRDALARKAAALGGGPSGAFIKQDQLAADASAQRLQQANEGINQQEQAALRDVNMTKLGQEYQTSEREAGQQFTAGQNAINQKLAEAGLTGTYNGQETFAAKQAAIQNKLAEAGLTGKYNDQDTMAAKQAAIQNKLAEAGLTGFYGDKPTLAQQQLDQSKTQFDWTKTQTDYENKLNEGTLAINAFTGLQGNQYTPDQIVNAIKMAYPNFDVSMLKGIVTPQGSGAAVPPAQAARLAGNPPGAQSVDQWQGRPDRYTNPNSPFYNP